MNRLSFLLLVLLLGFSHNLLAEVKRLSAPVVEDEFSETFGEVLDETLPKIEIANLLSDKEMMLGEPFRTKTRVAKVCQKKGCFFIAQDGEHVVRIAFKDYSFFIPTNASGKNVELAGVLIKKNMSQAQAEHFSQDLGGDTRFNAGEVYEIVAHSVVIPK